MHQVGPLLMPLSLLHMSWCRRVWCTRNCLLAVNLATGAAYNEYLPPLGTLLAFRSGDVVLLSEREADAVLACMWRFHHSHATRGRPQVTLLTLCYAQHAFAQHSSMPLLGHSVPAMAPGLALLPKAVELASMQVFDGQCVCSPRVMPELCALMRGRRQQVEALVGMRGKHTHFPRSDCD